MDTWTTKEGERIPVREMTDSHLDNAAAMMRRKGFVATSPEAFLSCGMPRGEMAMDAFMHEFDQACTRYHPALAMLEEEQERRGRKPTGN